ncbi:crossover junction endodeoxyribonuclease RuvC [Candidatus Babeliales bacterium]|nr:crossover junction endodeoxyribonuclease RuvC [Candidatus Babeliales bacterium]
MEEKVILGIDPGFGITGFSIIKSVIDNVYSIKSVLVDYGYLKLNSKKHLSVRIGIFYSFFKDKIEKFNITDISIETPFLGKNVQTFLKLGYLRGILYLLSNQHNLKLHEFSPRQVKVSVTGYGGATKDQVALMILNMFPKLNEFGKIEKNDVTDAIAVSICGLWEIRKEGLLSKAQI